MCFLSKTWEQEGAQLLLLNKHSNDGILSPTSAISIGTLMDKQSIKTPKEKSSKLSAFLAKALNQEGKNSDNGKILTDHDQALTELKKRFAPIERFTNRELSWLEFNKRVLEEAQDTSVPILERVKFLAITASNLDEFFMVRVAAVRRQIKAGVEISGPDGLTPQKVLKEITVRVNRMHENMGKCFETQIIPELANAGIYLVDEKSATIEQIAHANKFFNKKVKPLITPLAIDSTHPFPSLHNKMLYFCVERAHRPKSKKKVRLRLALVLIPSQVLGRFVQLTSNDEDKKYIIRLDDVIRLNFHEIFPDETVLGCHSIKVVRDAELEYVEDEVQDLLETLEGSLKQRRRGPATRFLYDAEMPPRVLQMFEKKLKLKSESMFPGARYHSFSDFFQFPGFEVPELQYEPKPPLPVAAFKKEKNIFSTIRKRDVLIHHPYQKFGYVIRMLKKAANDPNVIAIKISLYRISSMSPVAKALARAAKNGKHVTAIVELKARFDEEANISWARKLEKVGVHVIYGVPNLKTHCKLAMVVRKEADDIRLYCHLSTGNYNDKTSEIYGDIGLFTAREEITEEVARVFDMLTGNSDIKKFKHLLVAPVNMRTEFIKRIQREAENARAGKKSGIIVKMNSLVDPEIIDELYLASQAGVRIQFIIRGICCLKSRIAGLSDNISAISIIDRFLEHVRLYIFENDDHPEYILASADWMPRNLNRRIEVGFPILDLNLQKQLREFVDIQLTDNVKARILKTDSTNERKNSGGQAMRSQDVLYELAKRDKEIS